MSADGLCVRLPADSTSAGASRRAVAGWLRRICGLMDRCEVGEDLILAVSEAVTNSVEHAYEFCGDAEVLLKGELLERDASRAVRFTVVDEGGWKAPRDSGGLRGRGMAMIEMLVDRVTVESSERGTTVCMHRSVDCPGRLNAS